MNRAGTRAAVLLLFAWSARAGEALSFDDALARAIRTRGATEHYERQAAMLESLPVGTAPVLRVESGITQSENLNLLTERVDRFDAVTAIASIDYPLFDGAVERQRAAAQHAEAARLRQRARAEADDVFARTLEAFGDLYVAQRRLDLLRDDSAHLRSRADTLVEVGQISILTSAQWQDQALAAESLRLDLELQRRDAELRLRQLIGETTASPIGVCLECGRARERVVPPNAVAGANAFQAGSRPRILLSGFAGVADIAGTFGIYGARLIVTLPRRDDAHRAAAERIAFENARREERLAETAQRNEVARLRERLDLAEQRTALLAESVRIARDRAQSLARLVHAGVRTGSDAASAAMEIARRESDLVAAEVEAWKLRRRMEWTCSPCS